MTGDSSIHCSQSVGQSRWLVPRCFSVTVVAPSVSFFLETVAAPSKFLSSNSRPSCFPWVSVCDVNSSCWISLRTRLYRHFPFSQTCAWRMRDTRPLPLMAAMACDVIVFVNSLAPRTCVMRRWWAGWGFNEKFSSPSLQRYNERLRSGDAESWKMRGWEEVCGSELTFGSIRQVQTSPRLSAP